MSVHEIQTRSSADRGVFILEQLIFIQPRYYFIYNQIIL
jgi:hypothetical protein